MEWTPGGKMSTPLAGWNRFYRLDGAMVDDDSELGEAFPLSSLGGHFKTQLLDNTTTLKRYTSLITL